MIILKFKIVKLSFLFNPAKFCNQSLRLNLAVLTYFICVTSLIKVKDYGLNYIYIYQHNNDKQIACF